jgi:subtilisin family serine protease/Mg-chelatase subunit ChlD
MKIQAIIRKRRTERAQAVTAELKLCKECKLKVLHELPNGILVRGDEKAMDGINTREFLVTRIVEDKTFMLAGYEVKRTKGAPKIPAKLRVPKSEEKKWTDFLVKLVAPADREVIELLNRFDIEVIDKVASSAVWVRGSKVELERLSQSSLVKSTDLFHPAYKISPPVRGMKGKIKYLAVVGMDADTMAEVKELVGDLRGKIHREVNADESFRRGWWMLYVVITSTKVPELAAHPAVRWIEFDDCVDTHDDERTVQIVAGNLDATGTQPVTGWVNYANNEIGLDGTGTIVGICDTGVDTNDTTNVAGAIRTDFDTRVAFFVDATNGTTLTDTNGHGTHVAGIALGDGTSGDQDPQNFALGLGVAKGAQVGIMNSIATGNTFTDAARVTNMATNNAHVMNNSWGSKTGIGYTSREAIFDTYTRDPNPGAANNEDLVIVFAAGNYGGWARTAYRPHQAKNIITVGNSLTWRPGEGHPSDNIAGMFGSSSRGPCEDGRLVPHVVAPGNNIISASSSASVPVRSYTDTGGNAHATHSRRTGTSMAAPLVSGMAALLIEWWNDIQAAVPSQALVKAMLINGAVDMGGPGGENWVNIRPDSQINFILAADKDPNREWILHDGDYIFKWIGGLGYKPAAVAIANINMAEEAALANMVDGVATYRWFYDNGSDDLYVSINTGFSSTSTEPNDEVHVLHPTDLENIPSNIQGWGRANLNNIILQASDGATPDALRGPKIMIDQTEVFNANGEEYEMVIAPYDLETPLRITLTYTDKAGDGTLGAAVAPAFTAPALVNNLNLEVEALATGEVFKGNVFNNGFSVSGGNFDALNNTECIYIEEPRGLYRVTVIAANLQANAINLADIMNVQQDFALVIDNAENSATDPVSIVPVIDRSGSMVTAGYVDVTRLTTNQFIDLMTIGDSLGVVSFGNDGVVEYPAGAAPLTVTELIGQANKQDAKTAVDNVNFGGCTYMADGLEKGRDLLNGAVGNKGLVLFSDGYDNKGCDGGNPSKQYAEDLVNDPLWPDDIPVYACAMGPGSDIQTLQDIATNSGGVYYFMPAINDLFEIYNFIRGDVMDEGIIINQSAQASKSSVSGYVDGCTTEVTFTCAWHDPAMVFTSAVPSQNQEITVRLIDPNGKVLYPNHSYVKRRVGANYVNFNIKKPLPGKWHVEVETGKGSHTQYTVGGFVKSKIQLQVLHQEMPLKVGQPIKIEATVFDGDKRLTSFRTTTMLTRPKHTKQDLIKRYQKQLRKIKAKTKGKNASPFALQLMLLAQKMARKGKQLFERENIKMRYQSVTAKDLRKGGIIGDLTNGQVTRKAAAAPELFVEGLTNRKTAAGKSSTIGAKAIPGIRMAKTSQTEISGAYNVIVEVKGISADCQTKFVRKKLVCLIVND